ncbi:MAG: threonine ammonia-lyase [Actinobacteria bacterium]|nr:MAG: threonine ammonia-lyase [Actinomycetota bacterium]
MAEHAVSTGRATSITIDDVRAAADAIDGAVAHTPTVHSRTLSAITGADIWLKLENLQFTASFKERGALNRILRLTPEERARGVVAVSAGNHAQGVAYHASRLGVPATIVMPRATPNVKVANVEALGATVVLEGTSYAEAEKAALALGEKRGLAWVAPFDDPDVIAGQGTVGLELLGDVDGLDAVILPVGGGGLIAGVAIAVAALAPTTEAFGVESERYPCMANALRGSGEVPGGATIAEGIAVASAGRLTVPIVRAHGVHVVSVSEAALEQAVALFLEIEKTVVEGAGAAGLAAVLSDRQRFAGRRVGIVVTGGNIDLRLLAEVIMRSLVRSGRLNRLSIGVPDVPGALAEVASILGREGANIVEVLHQRMFSDLDVKTASLEIAVETRDRDQLERAVTALRDLGYHVTRPGP